MRIMQAIVASACLMGASAALAQAKPPAAKPDAPAQAPAAPAVAPVSGPETQTTTATYGDWLLRCQQAGARRTCEIIQSIILKGQTAPFAQIAFGKLAANDPMFVTLVVPHNVSLATKPRIGTDEKDTQAAELSWTRCLPAGCFATVATKDDVLKRWRAAEQPGRVSFPNAAGQDIVLPISFRGFAQAIDGMAKETKAAP